MSKRIKEEYKRGLRKSPKGKDVHQYDKKSGKYLKTFKNCTEAAEEYILMNKPCLSLNDIFKCDILKKLIFDRNEKD